MQVEVDGKTLSVTNLHKVLYPETGTTKGEVIDYYRCVADVMVPQAVGRPATRKRWVNGVGTADEPEESFFRKALEPSAPDWIARGKQHHKSGTTTYPIVDSAATLVWLAQLASLEIHTPQWRFDADGAPANPDRLVLDFDPGPGAGLTDCVSVARVCRDILADMGMACYPVTSGSKGIHLYAPLDGTATQAEVSEVAHELAKALAAERPDKVVSDMSKALREGKILIDWSQNSGQKTTVCPYSLRGKPRPTVAAPRTWDELNDADLRHLDLWEVIERVEAGVDPIAPLGLSTLSTAGADTRLGAYRAKRDAAKTPEPVPPAGDSGGVPGDAPMFVIQEHHATRLHWDFRLEHDGVLVSWAVPKGPPLEPGDNRLAVHTEDHPLSYGSFEGSIPKGEYGGGEVTIWDTGMFEVEKWRDDEVIGVVTGRPDGGLGGFPRRYAFIHSRQGGDDKNWLLVLMKEQPGATTADERGERVEPMLATLAEPKDVRGDDWWFEMKWDGIRCMVSVTQQGVELTSRNGHNQTAMFPELAELVDAIDSDVLARGETVLDGEIVALDGRDRPSFSRLQQRLGVSDPREVAELRQRVPVDFMVFDVVRVGGESLLREPLERRRETLEQIVRPTDHVHVPPVETSDMAAAIAVSKELDLEGVMAKRRSSVYLPGRRAKTWLKLKNKAHYEVVVVGWRQGEGERARTFSSLLVAVPNDDGELTYVGRVGSGFSDADLMRIRAELDRRARKTPPVEVPAEDARDACWVTPNLVAEVEFAELTESGRLRHAVWRGLRPDKDASTLTPGSDPSGS